MKETPPAFHWKAFLVELIIYSILVVGYFLLVLHYLGGWLKDLFDHDRWLYAFACILLMLGQAVMLEVLTTFLARLTQSKTE